MNVHNFNDSVSGMKPTVFWYRMKNVHISDKTINGELAFLIMVFAMDSKDKHG